MRVSGFVTAVAFSLSFFLGQMLVVAEDADTAAVTMQSARQMAGRSVAYINREGASWRKSKGCLSCHRLTFTSWALNRASEQGVKVDSEMLGDWNTYTSDWKSLTRPKDRDTAEKQKLLKNENDAVAQLVLGQPRGAADEADATRLAAYRQSLLDAQLENGAWKHGGQLPAQDRPSRETGEVSTMWAMLALLEKDASDEATKAAIEKADAWLGDKTTGVSTEWWAVRLILKRRQGETQKADKLQVKLLELQNEDGGWGWQADRESDALATGVALYALARDGYRIGQPAARRGIEFLSSTQQEDGSWRVPGTKKNAKGRVTGTASYWGACWAVIGALEFARQPVLEADAATSSASKPR